MKTLTCPCCGSYMGELPEANRVAEKLPHRERTIFLALHSASPNGVDVISLAEMIDRSASEKAVNRVRNIVTTLRHHVEPYGYHIPRNPAGGGRLSKYRLLPMEVGQ